MEKTFHWNIDKCFSETQITDEEKIQKWNTKWSYKRYPNISGVNMTFEALHTPSQTKIQALEIQTDEFINSSEVNPLIEKSCENLNPSLFFKQFQTFLKMHSNRVKFIQAEKLDVLFNKENGTYCIMFYRNNSKEPLARVHWSVLFQKNLDAFKESYEVNFTAKGIVCHLVKQNVLTVVSRK